MRDENKMTYSQLGRMPRSIRRSQTVGVYQPSGKALGPMSNVLFLAAVLTVMGLIYLTQITKTSVFGFEVNELKQQKQTLAEDNQNLRIEAARLQAIERIRASEVAGKLQPNDQLTFAGQSSNQQ